MAAAELREKKIEWASREQRHEEATRVAEMEWQLDHERCAMQETVRRLEQKVEVLCAGIQQQEEALLARERAVFDREIAARDNIDSAQLAARQMRQKLDDATYVQMLHLVAMSFCVCAHTHNCALNEPDVHVVPQATYQDPSVPSDQPLHPLTPHLCVYGT